MRVDFHTHFIPEHLPALGEKYSDEGWPALIHNAPCQADIYFAGKHYRRIDDRSWDLQRRLKDMAVEGVDVQVLSPIPVTFAYDFSAQGALELAQMQNEEIAEAVAASPEYFIGLGTVPLQDPGSAANEVRRVRREQFSYVPSTFGEMPEDCSCYFTIAHGLKIAAHFDLACRPLLDQKGLPGCLSRLQEVLRAAEKGSPYPLPGDPLPGDL